MQDTSREECHSPLHDFNSRWQETTTSPHEAQKNFLKHLLYKFDNSLIFTVLRLLIPLFKFVATIIVLCKNEAHISDHTLNTWLKFIVLNDLIAVVLKSLSLKNHLEIERVRRSSTLPDLLRMDGTYHLRNIMGEALNRDTLASSSYNKKVETKRSITLLWWLKVMFHLALIIYGNRLYYHLPLEMDTPRKTLALIHLIIGYTYIAIPTLLVVLVFLWFTGSSLKLQKLFKKKNKTFKVQIDKLRSEQYSGEIEGYHECSICGQDYTKGQTLIRLDCDSTHHFHKTCLQKELKKSPTCPLCGVDIENENDISLKAVHSPLNLSYSVERVL